MTLEFWWRDEDAEHIRVRSSRYDNSTGVEPAWTFEAVADPFRIVRAPDPKSKWGYTRVIGYSPSADFVITVIINPARQAGVTAWKTSGADLREYRGLAQEGEGRP